MVEPCKFSVWVSMAATCTNSTLMVIKKKTPSTYHDFTHLKLEGEGGRADGTKTATIITNTTETSRVVQ